MNDARHTLLLINATRSFEMFEGLKNLHQSTCQSLLAGDDDYNVDDVDNDDDDDDDGDDDAFGYDHLNTEHSEEVYTQ